MIQRSSATSSGPLYGSLLKSWQCFLSSADRLASLHASICRSLVSEDGDKVRTWQKDTFHKKLFGGFKESQDIDTGFARAQKPWAKRLKKVWSFYFLCKRKSQLFQYLCKAVWSWWELKSFIQTESWGFDAVCFQHPLLYIHICYLFLELCHFPWSSWSETYSSGQKPFLESSEPALYCLLRASNIDRRKSRSHTRVCINITPWVIYYTPYFITNILGTRACNATQIEISSFVLLKCL